MAQTLQAGHGHVVLFADDDEAMRDLVRDSLGRLGHRVALAADGGEALDLAVSERPDVIIADLCMHAGGLGLVARLRSVAPRTPIVLLSASLPAGTCTPGVAVCLCKPVRMADLAAAIGQVVPA